VMIGAEFDWGITVRSPQLQLRGGQTETTWCQNWLSNRIKLVVKEIKTIFIFYNFLLILIFVPMLILPCIFCCFKSCQNNNCSNNMTIFFMKNDCHVTRNKRKEIQEGKIKRAISISIHSCLLKNGRYI
jgi:hypothetical protein